MKNKLSNYDEVLTDDGSITVFSKIFGETCHSKSGARLETRLHYIKGCRVTEQLKHNDPLIVFEAGFGVGIGFEETLKSMNGRSLVFISTEIDEELVCHIVSNNNIYNGITKRSIPFTHFYLKNKNLELYILIGDARVTTPKLKELGSFSFNCIYQDAFSPKRNAVLWTKEWFEDLKSYAHENCIMSTYSASSSIRKSMIGAGWTIYDGKDFGVKRSSTRAKLTGSTDKEILDRLERSPVAMITDKNYKDYTLGK